MPVFQQFRQRRPEGGEAAGAERGRPLPLYGQGGSTQHPECLPATPGQADQFAGRPLIERILGTDPPSTALNAAAVIWQFFARHPKPAG